MNFLHTNFNGYVAVTYSPEFGSSISSMSAIIVTLSWLCFQKWVLKTRRTQLN